MTAHPDILDSSESLRKPLVNSLAVHLAIAGVVLFYTFRPHAPAETFGNPSAISGGAYSITPVSKIPLPSHRGAPNPVANDTVSQISQAPKPEPKKAVAEPPKAAEVIPGRDAKAAKQAKQPSRYQPPTANPDQLHSSQGAATVSPLYGTTGSGGVTIGPGGAFGSRFGWYSDLIREKVSQNWKTDVLDPRLQSAPMVIVAFSIRRDGSITSPQLQQRSGNLALDNSCMRAILTSAPFPGLPNGFGQDSATIEFQFQLQRNQ